MADSRRAHDFHRNFYPYLRGENPRQIKNSDYRERESGRLPLNESRTGGNSYEWDFAEKDFSRDYNRDYAHLDYDPDRSPVRLRHSRPGPHVGKGPKGWSRSDERIRETVSEFLDRDPWIDASEIEVQVKDGVVTLEGSVDERRTRKLVEELVENCRGVLDVRNFLTVRRSL